jgi:hypothetical protein
VKYQADLDLMPMNVDLDTLTIPIIENTPDEEDLRFDMETALIEYPNACVPILSPFLAEVAAQLIAPSYMLAGLPS